MFHVISCRLTFNRPAHVSALTRTHTISLSPHSGSRHLGKLSIAPKQKHLFTGSRVYLLDTIIFKTEFLGIAKCLF